jgi:hypothetical protein
LAVGYGHVGRPVFSDTDLQTALRTEREAGETSVPLGPAATTRGGGCVVSGDDTQIADFVPEGVPVNSHVLRRPRQITLVGAQHGDDVLLLELTLGLIEGHASTHQLIDNLKETSV